MANISELTSGIENYENMSAEERLDAILNLNIPSEEPDLSGYVKKDMLDKARSEVANLSKQLKTKTDEAKALMSEEQQKQAALAEAAEAEKAEKEELKARIADLEKQNTLREFTMSFAGLGLDEKLSSETATALVDNDSTKMFANLKKFLDGYKKSIEAEMMSKTPQPNGGSAGQVEKNVGVDKAKALAATSTQNSRKQFGNIIDYYKKH